MPFLLLTIGIPGSGKSTWVKKCLKVYPAVQVVSNDEIRRVVFNDIECVTSLNKEVYSKAHEIAESFLKEGKDVIIDATNADLSEWIAYKKISERIKGCILVGVFFTNDITEAVKNMEKRERKVPLYVLEMKRDQILRNKEHAPMFFNLIFDSQEFPRALTE